jgi:U3 small nucleolar RNA-associated protein 12
MQVWCLAVSSLGDFAVSGGADRSLRVWTRTEEPFFVEEEREKRLESLFEADLEVGRFFVKVLGFLRHCSAW